MPKGLLRKRLKQALGYASLVAVLAGSCYVRTLKRTDSMTLARKVLLGSLAAVEEGVKRLKTKVQG